MNGDREVAFRHHILFDYVASRTVVDFDNAAKTDELLNEAEELASRSGALLRAPTSVGDLRTGTRSLLAGSCSICGAAADPIARSVAARVGCDLPSEADDTAGFVRLMAQPSESERAFGAFRHIVGALSVGIKMTWAHHQRHGARLPSPLCRLSQRIAWSLQTLIHNLIDRVTDPDLRRQVGLRGKGGHGLRL